MVMLVIGVGLGACGQEAPSYSSVAELAAAMKEGGAGCHSLSRLDAADLVSDRAVCKVDGSTVNLYLFSSDANQREWLAVGSELGPVIEGPDWAVVPTDPDIVRKIADATGGTLR